MRSHPLLAPSLQRGIVLLIEDDDLVARAIQRLSSNVPVEFVHAPSVESCEQALDGAVPDAIVLDLVLPGGMNGLDAIPVLKERFPKASIVVFTGHAACDVAAVATQRGAYRVLEKDGSHCRLAYTLGEAIRHSRSEPGPSPVDVALRNTSIRLSLGDASLAVLRGVLEEREEKEIAAVLGLCLKTVQYHIRRLKDLLGAESWVGMTKRVLLS